MKNKGITQEEYQSQYDCAAEKENDRRLRFADRRLDSYKKICAHHVNRLIKKINKVDTSSEPRALWINVTTWFSIIHRHVDPITDEEVCSYILAPLEAEYPYLKFSACRGQLDENFLGVFVERKTK